MLRRFISRCRGFPEVLNKCMFQSVNYSFQISNNKCREELKHIPFYISYFWRVTWIGQRCWTCPRRGSFSVAPDESSSLSELTPDRHWSAPHAISHWKTTNRWGKQRTVLYIGTEIIHTASKHITYWRRVLIEPTMWPIVINGCWRIWPVEFFRADRTHGIGISVWNCWH